MKLTAALFVALIALASDRAHAHISASGLAVPKSTAEVTINVPHGCSEPDPADPTNAAKTRHYPAYKITVGIHPGVTAVKTFHNAFGKATLTKDAAGNVTVVTWTKDGPDEVGDDVAFRFVLRGTFPDAPFTKAYFPATAFCRKEGAADLSDAYTTLPAPPGTPTPDAGAAVPPAAPSIPVLPARAPGWNKYTVPVAIADVSVFFKDALVVWAGNAAYSGNTTTFELIKKEQGVTVLTSVAAGTELWVKY